MEKQVSIVVAATGTIKDIAISPGATVRDILQETDLQGYQLSRKGGEPLSPDTDLYEDAGHGEKLYATPQDVSVGEGGFASLFDSEDYLKRIRNNNIVKPQFFESLNPIIANKVRTFGSRPISLPIQSGIRVIREYKTKETKIISQNKEYPYWQENGWRKKGKSYNGYYKIRHGSWSGLIEENFFNDYSFYIFNPPKELKNHSHWTCFTHKGNGKYSIHFSDKPDDISAGIIKIEQILNESIKKGEKKCTSNGKNGLREFVSNLLKGI